MSTLYMIKNTSNKIKEVTLTCILAASLLGVTLSTNANAASKISADIAIDDFIVTQVQKIVTKLNTQLQQSIAKEIQMFATNYTLNNAEVWLTADHNVKQATPAVNDNSKATNKVTSNTANTKNNQ